MKNPPGDRGKVESVDSKTYMQDRKGELAEIGDTWA